MTTAMEWVIMSLAGRATQAPDIVQSAHVMISLTFVREEAQTIVAGMLIPIIERQLVSDDIVAQHFGQQVVSLARAASRNINVAESEMEEDLIDRARKHGAPAVAIRLAIMKFELLAITDKPCTDAHSLDTRSDRLEFAKRWYDIGKFYLATDHELLVSLNNGIEGARSRLAKAKLIEASRRNS